MIQLRALAFLLATALPVTGFAGPALLIKPVVGDQTEEPFPGYDEACGFTILEAPIPQRAIAMKDTRGALVIVLDPSLRAEELAAQRLFLIAHECAHHKLEHTTTGAVRSRREDASVVRDHEMSADCWAAELLSKSGHEDVLRIVMNHFYALGRKEPGLGYPSGQQRSRIILRCSGLG